LIAESNFQANDKSILVARRNTLRQTLEDQKKTIDEYANLQDVKINMLGSKLHQADDELSYVLVYEHCEFQGKRTVLPIGLHTPEPDVGGISAFIIPPGMKITLYTGNNFQGQKLDLYHTSPSFQKSCMVNNTFQYEDTQFQEEYTDVIEGFRGVWNRKKTPFFMVNMIRKRFLPPGRPPKPIETKKNIVKLPFPRMFKVAKLTRTSDFNDNIRSIRVERVQSVYDFMETWNGQP
jgi:hypothetical protein